MIEKVRMRHIRRFDDQTMDLTSGVNLIEGVNNAGKSTILYAIEYGLFGHVRGFKKKSEYTTRGVRDGGVELLFKGNDGNRYRLMRFHKLASSSKVTNSHFTLKRIVSDEAGTGEEYVLSSDFGHTEEQLALKVRELTGISKRLFEVTVSARQGQLPDLLHGSDALDIVLGVTAADALTQAFRDRKRDMEKDLSQIPVLNILLEKTKDEKEQLESQFRNLEANLKKTTESIDELESSLSKMAQLSSVLSNLSSVRSSWESSRQEILVSDSTISSVREQLEKKGYRGSLEAWEKQIGEVEKEYNSAVRVLETHRERSKESTETVSKAQQELGSLRGKLSSICSSVGVSPEILTDAMQGLRSKAETGKAIGKLRTSLDNLQKERSEVLHERGDLEGRLTRRKSVSGTQTCEYCGASLDPEKVKSDTVQIEKNLKDLEKRSKKVEAAISSEEKELIKLENDLVLIDASSIQDDVRTAEELLENLQKSNSTFAEESELLIRKESELKQSLDERRNALSEVTQLAERLETLEKKQTSLKDQLAKAKTDFGKYVTSLRKAIKDDNSDFNRKLSGSLDGLDSKEWDEFPSPVRDIEQLVVERRTEIRVQKDQKNSEKDELVRDQRELQTRRMSIDSEISSTESKLDGLIQMQGFADKYGKLADAFKDVQSQIRENASVNLSSSTLNIHRSIVPESEIVDLRIRPEDYSIEVQPKDWSEMVPATVYQGGGMQLLLGLSYRLAIGDFVRGVPFLFADEPTYGADSENRKRVLSSFQNISMSPQTLLVTHQSDSLKFEPQNRVLVKRMGDFSVIEKVEHKPPKKSEESKHTPKKSAKTSKTKITAKPSPPKQTRKSTTKRKKGGVQ